MTTCDVLRCQQASSASFNLLKEPLLESLVCQDHKALLEKGDLWMLDADSGILMGSDIPPKLVDYSASELLSGTRGFAFNMELETPDGPRSQSVWISREDGRRLGEFLSTRPL